MAGHIYLNRALQAHAIYKAQKADVQHACTMEHKTIIATGEDVTNFLEALRTIGARMDGVELPKFTLLLAHYVGERICRYPQLHLAEEAGAGKSTLCEYIYIAEALRSNRVFSASLQGGSFGTSIFANKQKDSTWMEAEMDSVTVHKFDERDIKLIAEGHMRREVPQKHRANITVDWTGTILWAGQYTLEQ